jgi:IrrE N-terminal-like domain
MLVRPTFTLDAIEAKARALRRELWDNQVALWPGQKVTPLGACDPEVAARHLGYEYQEGNLDSAGSRAGQYVLAGFIDRSQRLIAVAENMKPHIKRFTAAHEVGHLLLHPDLHHHRERPHEGVELYESLAPHEREANLFAGCFLVPPAALRKAFRVWFQVDELRLTDTVAYQLVGPEFQALLAATPQSLTFPRLVAQCGRFNGRQFDPLHRLFGVSVTTMAIRLRQVGLVRGHY